MISKGIVKVNKYSMVNGPKLKVTLTHVIYCPVMRYNFIFCSQAHRFGVKIYIDDDGLEPSSGILKMIHKTTQEVCVIGLERESGLYEVAIVTAHNKDV